LHGDIEHRESDPRNAEPFRRSADVAGGVRGVKGPRHIETDCIDMQETHKSYRKYAMDK